MCEVVSFLTKSEVGWDTICSKGGRFQITVVSVTLSPIFELSNFACSDVNTGGGENSHLSLRNACGECLGVAGGVLSLSSKGSSCIFGDGITGRKGSLSFKNTVLLFSMSKSILSSMSSILYTFH